MNYLFDKGEIQKRFSDLTEKSQKGYVCVADGVTVSSCYWDSKLRKVLSDSTITVCDSGWVPVYLKLIYGIERGQYTGYELLNDIVEQKKYNLLFLGSSDDVLQALKYNLSIKDERIRDMCFEELPFLPVESFDYPAIGELINEIKPDIIFVSLGMPKQEFFMHHLLPYINRGVLVGVGAAFNFHSGLSKKRRAPKWMIAAKIEWAFRIFSEPKKQIKRCLLILGTTPLLFVKEIKKNKRTSPYEP